jgi:hypothetical protein
MLQIFSTGRPVLASDIRTGDVISVDGEIINVTDRHKGSKDTVTIWGDILGQPWSKQFFVSDHVNLADEESLNDVSVSMDLYLALRDKGAMS